MNRQQHSLQESCPLAMELPRIPRAKHSFCRQTEHICLQPEPRGACELCPLNPSINLGVLSGFAGTPLRIVQAVKNLLGQLLTVSRAEKSLCDIEEANNQLVGDVLHVTLR